MQKRAITYARVSGDDRKKAGRNLEGQLDMCREYALRQGYVLVAELSEDDRGASGASFELEQLSKILELACNHAFDVLIVREVDRLSRNLAKQLVVEEWLKREGVSIEYVLGQYPDTAEGNLMKNIRATVAEFERLKIVERNKRGRRLKTAAGSVMVHGQAPYGYTLVKDEHRKWRLEINPHQAAIVELIYQWYTMGDGEIPPLAIRGIAKRLSEMGVPTYQDVKNAELAAECTADGETKRYGRKRRNVGEWSEGTIANMLRNETYTGLWHYGKRGEDTDGKRFMHDPINLIAVEVPPIVSRDIWEAAQARRAYNKENSLRNQKYQYLLSKRVRCGVCNCKMHAVPNHTRGRLHFYYMCKAKQFYTVECNNNSTYSMRDLDAKVWEWVKGLLSDPDELERGLEEYKSRREIDLAPLRQRLVVVEDLLGENRRHLDRLLDLYLNGDFPKDTLTERKMRLEETINGLEREQNNIIARLNEALTPELEQAIRSLPVRAGKGLLLASDRFDVRRRIIELLQVTVILSKENDQKIARVSCMLGDNVLELIGNRKRGNGEGGGGLQSVVNSTVMELPYSCARVYYLTFQIDFGSTFHILISS